MFVIFVILELKQVKARLIKVSQNFNDTGLQFSTGPIPFQPRPKNNIEASNG